MLDNLKADIDRYVYRDPHGWLYNLLTKQGLWAIVEYRAHRWVYTKVRVPVVRRLLMLACLVWHKAVEITTGIDLPETVEIGKGLYIGHFGGLFLAGNVKIGEYCNLSQGVTIGVAGRGENRGVPVLGDRVYVAAGAKVIGRIVIGSDVAIGANAVVTKDLPDRAVAVGIPAKVINLEGSADFVHFRKRKETRGEG